MSQQQQHNNADRTREQHLTEQDGVRLRQSHSRTESCMSGGGEVDAACPCSNDDETEHSKQAMLFGRRSRGISGMAVGTVDTSQGKGTRSRLGANSFPGSHSPARRPTPDPIPSDASVDARTCQDMASRASIPPLTPSRSAILHRNSTMQQVATDVHTYSIRGSGRKVVLQPYVVGVGCHEHASASMHADACPSAHHHQPPSLSRLGRSYDGPQHADANGPSAMRATYPPSPASLAQTQRSHVPGPAAKLPAALKGGFRWIQQSSPPCPPTRGAGSSPWIVDAVRRPPLPGGCPPLTAAAREAQRHR